MLFLKTQKSFVANYPPPSFSLTRSFYAPCLFHQNTLSYLIQSRSVTESVPFTGHHGCHQFYSLPFHMAFQFAFRAVLHHRVALFEVDLIAFFVQQRCPSHSEVRTFHTLKSLFSIEEWRRICSAEYNLSPWIPEHHMGQHQEV